MFTIHATEHSFDDVPFRDEEKRDNIEAADAMARVFCREAERLGKEVTAEVWLGEVCHRIYSSNPSSERYYRGFRG